MGCVKKPYSKKTAQTVLNKLIQEGRWNNKSDYGRIYECHCGHWHITSQDDEYRKLGRTETVLLLKDKFINLLKNQE